MKYIIYLLFTVACFSQSKIDSIYYNVNPCGDTVGIYSLQIFYDKNSALTFYHNTVDSLNKIIKQKTKEVTDLYYQILNNTYYRNKLDSLSKIQSNLTGQIAVLSKQLIDKDKTIVNLSLSVYNLTKKIGIIPR